MEVAIFITFLKKRNTIGNLTAFGMSVKYAFIKRSPIKNTFFGPTGMLGHKTDTNGFTM